MAGAANFITYAWKGAIQPNSANVFGVVYQTVKWKGALQPQGVVPTGGGAFLPLFRRRRFYPYHDRT